MKTSSWFLLSAFAVTLGLTFGACKSGGEGAGGQTSSTTTTGTGGAPACSDNGDDCSVCVATKCCAPILACQADALCNDICLANGDDAACQVDQPFLDLIQCLDQDCAVCKAKVPSACNPVTNEGCINHKACDLAENATYQCFSGNNVVALCGTCDDASQFCKPGLRCRHQVAGDKLGQCARYCCDDGDCGSGKCDKTNLTEGVGYCVAMGDAGPTGPACDAPSVAPSGGGCWDPDAGTPDAGELDAGTPDAGELDASTPDAGELDAGAPDAGSDAGDAGGG
jgi:hypothetical protein